MGAASIAILAFSLSMDAFAVALGRGAAERVAGFGRTLRTGAIFGLVEAITPIVGWLLGLGAMRHVKDYDHWLAFFILAFIGGRMVLAALRGTEEALAPGRRSTMLTVVTALGTSIDAMAVGLSLAFLQVGILPMALATGLATLLMTTLGSLLGQRLGRRYGRVAVGLGGLVVCAVGLTLLLEHLGAAHVFL